ncbi:hypothetical protein OIDMADRAFT_56360 [Oidiodendron maius Zn]|uniref:Ankyrin n=1 Tax=Oidiodendron maius (strain Zn) TaxID=913774 RepID=A0A0C3GT67_OIDMZ|nr:hypothetical protein OIDMADRAFT_56360 [Oidiodendron maius Zn]
MPDSDLTDELELQEADEATDRAQPLHDNPLGNSRLPPTALSPLDNRRSIVQSALDAACKSGDLALTQSILAEHGEYLADQEDIENLLGLRAITAGSRGYADIVSCLLDHGAGCMPSVALFAGSKNSDVAATIRVFEVLFNHGLDLKDAPNVLSLVAGDDTQTPLLRYLLSKGADPDTLDDLDNLALELCDSDASIGILLDYGADTTHAKLLHWAVGISDDEKCIKQMEFVLGRGVDINARATYPGNCPPGSRVYAEGMRRTGNEGTALHWAVRGWYCAREVNRLARVKWLLEKGADKDILDNQGLKAIDYTSDQEIINLLSE